MVEPRIINNNFFSLLNNFIKGVKIIHLLPVSTSIGCFILSSES